MKAIVTVKLPRNPHHNPQRKRSGRCPLINRFCTDVTGSHHSYIETGKDRWDIERKVKKKYGHVTRIEVTED